MKRIADSHIHIRFFEFEHALNMFRDIAECGVTDAAILSLPYYGVVANLAAIYFKQFNRSVDLRAFGGFHTVDQYAEIPPEVQLEALIKLGIDGFKIMNCPTMRRYCGIGIDDEYYEKTFALLEENGLPVNFHVADPETFWDEGRSYADPTFPSKKQLYDETLRVIERHPNLKVVFAHFFFLSNFPEEAERILEKYPNVYFDLTPGTEMYYNFDKNIEYWQGFFEKYKNRLLFGTDANANKDCNKELEDLVYRKLTESTDFFTQHCYERDFVVRGLELDDETVDAIAYKNYFSVFGKEKRPVDMELFYEYCEKVLNDLENMEGDPYQKNRVEIVPKLDIYPSKQVSLDFLRRALKER